MAPNPRTNRGNTTARGMGYTHQKKKRALPPPTGQPCPYCGQPMWPNQQLDADHTIPRALGGRDSPLRWAHRYCNRSAGSRMMWATRTRTTPTRTTSRNWGRPT